jgi:putative ABC transport system permease protein
MINIPVTVKIALRALKANKMRSALTTLGIVIGVAAVIAMLALGSGARQKVSEEIASMGSNLLVVISGSVSSGGARMGSGTDPTLSLLDAEAVERECPAVLDVAPVDRGTAQIVYGNQNWSTVITGTTPSILHINAWDIASGRPFTMQDVRHATKVCLMGKTVTDNLFLGTDPVGKIVRIKKVPFKVIGVLGSKGQTMLGQDHDDVIYVPITTGQKKLFGTTIAGMIRVMMVKAKSVNKLEEAETQINELLKQRHRIRPNQDNDFTVKNLTQMMQTAENLTKIMTLLLGAIASISLLVGGIGIMNIMLVSVTERTREIGIRIAVGAKTWDIRLQFIIEAIILSLIGGCIGMLIGVAGSVLVSSLTGFPVIISPLAIFLSFGFSAGVGVFFGFYPAYKASLLNPIDALRYE